MGWASHWGPGGGDAAEVGLFQAMWFPPELVAPTEWPSVSRHMLWNTGTPTSTALGGRVVAGGGFLSCILL